MLPSLTTHKCRNEGNERNKDKKKMKYINGFEFFAFICQKKYT